MKKIRSRLTILLSVIVIFTSALSLCVFILAQNNIIFHRDDMENILLGFALRDILLLAIAYLIIVGAILLFI